MAWLMQSNKMQFYETSATVCLFIRFVCIGLTALTGTKVRALIEAGTWQLDPCVWGSGSQE